MTIEASDTPTAPQFIPWYYGPIRSEEYYNLPSDVAINSAKITEFASKIFATEQEDLHKSVQVHFHPTEPYCSVYLFSLQYGTGCFTFKEEEGKWRIENGTIISPTEDTALIFRTTPDDEDEIQLYYFLYTSPDESELLPEVRSSLEGLTNPALLREIGSVENPRTHWDVFPLDVLSRNISGSVKVGRINANLAVCIDRIKEITITSARQQVGRIR